MKRFVACMGLVLALGLAPASWAQSLGGAFNREDVPLLPSLGNWWTPDLGAGRWGLTIEAQVGSAFPQGLMGVAVFSYLSGDPSVPTWYSVSRPYQYNPDWRQDGYIGDMELNLVQSTNGTCLLCQDGGSGQTMNPDVNSARIVFRDSMNAELIVGDVTHPLIKSQWGDGLRTSLDEFWTQALRFNVEASYLNTRINGFGNVTPVRATETVTYEGMDGWDVSSFITFVVAETVSSGQQVNVQQQFQILSHEETNQYRLIYPSLTASSRLDFKLFPQSRFIVEGRLINHVGLNTQNVAGNVLFMAVPSMQPLNGNARPWY